MEKILIQGFLLRFPSPIVCYDADIAVDLIVSNAWLASMDIDVCPSRHGLEVNRPSGPVWLSGHRFQGDLSQSFADVAMVQTDRLASKDSPSSAKYYAVRTAYVQEIVGTLELKPERDCFASADNSV